MTKKVKSSQDLDELVLLFYCHFRKLSVFVSIGPVQTVRHTHTKKHKLICPGHGAPSLWHTHIHLWVIVCIRQGRGRPHYGNTQDIDDNAVIAYISAKSRTLADDSFAGRRLPDLKTVKIYSIICLNAYLLSQRHGFSSPLSYFIL